MIKPPKLYLKRKDIPIESLYDMRDESGKLSKAGTYNKKDGSVYLVGGDFVIWDDVEYRNIVELTVGETIFFSSFRNHEVRKVMKGEREVLVAWIYKKS